MMNRREFVSHSIALVTSVTGLLGMGVGIIAISKCGKQPVARLVNNEKGTWYNGRADKGNVCRDEDLLLYLLDGGTSQECIASWNVQIAALVKDGYAEYV